ncbi:MAG: DUF3822 family protein [Flavobacteriaceae bacterium]|nr:DUF3822 family protein [Flavobacteriaceae bacterium]
MMVKKKIQINKSSAEYNKPEENHLSIQISLDGFSFCAINKVSKSPETLSHTPFSVSTNIPHKHLENVKEVFEAEPVLQKKFSSVSVSHVNSLASIVPKALFDENSLPQYLKYNLKIYKNDFIAFDQIPNHDLINIYIPFVNINNFLFDKFGEFEFKHSATVLLQSLLDVYRFSEKPRFFVNVRETHFDLVAIANNQLQLFNSFTYENKADFIYYILFTAEQLNFNPEYFELVLMGSVIKNDALYEIAYQYIRNVTLIESRSNLVLNNSFTDDIQRQFYILLHQF